MTDGGWDYEGCASVHLNGSAIADDEYLYERYGWREWAPSIFVMINQWWRFPAAFHIDDVMASLGLEYVPRYVEPEGEQQVLL